MSRRDDLDRFYGLMDELRHRLGGYRYLKDCTAKSGWPKQGVYFFLEPGEYRENGRDLRVVRVGTHAVSAGSRTTLWNRLAQHKGHTGGAHGGGGNHRGSIFRLHVGTALLGLGGWPASVGRTWGDRAAGSRAVREVEYPLEVAVSTYIGNMPFLWVEVADPAGKASARAVIEAGAIGLLSNLNRPVIDPASPGWLGRHAARAAVRGSGLWNVDHVDEGYDPRFLEVLADAIRRRGQ